MSTLILNHNLHLEEIVSRIGRSISSNLKYFILIVIISPTNGLSFANRDSQMEKCVGKEETCKANLFVYYSCCHTDCCVHLQALPYLGFWLIVFVALSCCCYRCWRACCCKSTKRLYEPASYNLKFDLPK